MMRTLCLLIITSGCMTIKPRISRDNIDACKSLCRGNKGLMSMAIEVQVAVNGKVAVLSEECSCHNKVSFQIIGSDYGY